MPAVDFVHPIEALIPGAQGRLLSVLVETSSELNLRTLARLAGISQAQASRVLPDLVALGVVERREVPPSSLFRLVPEHVAAGALHQMSRATDRALEEMGRLASALHPTPTSVIVFGSFARREAGVTSDIDVLVVRPSGTDEDDDRWTGALDSWRADLRRLTGNVVDILEVSADDAPAKLASRGQLWADIRRDGRVVHGLSIDDLRAAHRA